MRDASSKKTTNYTSTKNLSFDRIKKSKEPEIELNSNAFHSMPEDNERNKLEVHDRSIQVDSQMINAQLGKHDQIRNKVKQKYMSMGKPMGITNFCVDMPCVVIIVGVLCLVALCYYALIEELFKFTDENPRQWLVLDDEKLYAFDLQTVARKYFNDQEREEMISTRSQKMDQVTSQIGYISKRPLKHGTNLLEPENFIAIYQLEEKIKELSMWHDVCLGAFINESCSKQAFFSPIQLIAEQITDKKITNATKQDIVVAF